MDKCALLCLFVAVTLCDSTLFSQKTSKRQENDVIKGEVTETASTEFQTFGSESLADDDFARVITYAWPFNQLKQDHNTTDDEETEVDGTNAMVTDVDDSNLEATETVTSLKTRPSHVTKSDQGKPFQLGGKTHHKGHRNKKHRSKYNQHKARQGRKSRGKGHHHGAKRQHNRLEIHPHHKRVHGGRDNAIKHGRIRDQAEDRVKQIQQQIRAQIRQRMQRLKRSHQKQSKGGNNNGGMDSLLRIEPTRDAERRRRREECGWLGTFNCARTGNAHGRRKRVRNSE